MIVGRAGFEIVLEGLDLAELESLELELGFAVEEEVELGLFV